MVPPNSFGPPTMVAVVVDFKDLVGIAKIGLILTILQGKSNTGQNKFTSSLTSKLVVVVLCNIVSMPTSIQSSDTSVASVQQRKQGYIEHGNIFQISPLARQSTLRVAHVFGPYSRQNIKKIPFAWDTKRDFCSLYNCAILRHFSSHPRTWRDMQSALALSACLRVQRK